MVKARIYPMVYGGKCKMDLNHPSFLLSSGGIWACVKTKLERHSWWEQWKGHMQALTTLMEVSAINLELWGAPREQSTRLSLELYNITTSLWEQDVFITTLLSHRLALEVVPLMLHVNSIPTLGIRNVLPYLEVLVLFISFWATSLKWKGQWWGIFCVRAQ